MAAGEVAMLAHSAELRFDKPRVTAAAEEAQDFERADYSQHHSPMNSFLPLQDEWAMEEPS
jgi:hypothetical protein